MKKLLLFAMISIIVSQSLDACKFLMQNDSSDEILLIDPAVPTEIIKIKAKKEKIIGDPARHVHYRVFANKGGMNNPTFFLEFEMVGCAQPGTQPQVSISQLLAKTQPELFQVITANNLATVVTQQGAGHCSACQAKREQQAAK